MLQKNIMAGVKVADNRVLIAVTEMNSKIDIENYNKAIDEIL